MTWSLIFHNDGNGNVKSGSKNELIAHIKSGGQIKLAIVTTKDYHFFVQASAVIVKNGTDTT